MPAEFDEPESMTRVLAELAEAEADEAQSRADAERARTEAELLRAEPSSGRSPSTVALAIAALLIGVAITATALMLWQHRGVAAHRTADNQFVDAARSGVLALLSIDHRKAKEDVQRILDLSTGSFRADFARRADDFIQTAEKSQAVTKGSVSVAALESSAVDSAVVLIAASSQVTNANGAKEDPRPWRMSVTVTRDGDKMKMSGVEFVP
jgi:Mce-associated membrane protein